MTESFQYLRPRRVDNLEDCRFYHAMDLPGIGTVEGSWDLRSTAEAYFGGFDFAGKRALDMGTASGFLTFEMEKRGATVVSFDVGDESLLNLVPFVMADYDIASVRSEAARRIEQTRNGYWLAHRCSGSRAQAFYGDVYNLPDGLGPFDVVVFGMILPHLRDPFQALYSGSRRSREWLLITQQALDTPEAKMVFMPDPVAYPVPRDWWFMSDGCMERMFRVLGFELVSKTRSSHYCTARLRAEEITTYVARRQSGEGCDLLPQGIVPIRLLVGSERRAGGDETEWKITRLPGSEVDVRLVAVDADYGRESDEEGWWYWTRKRSVFSFSVEGPAQAPLCRLRFQCLAARPKTAVVYHIVGEGLDVEDSIEVTGWTLNVSKPFALPRGKLEIRIFTDSEPVRLGSNDPRLASYLMKNVELIPADAAQDSPPPPLPP